MIDICEFGLIGPSARICIRCLAPSDRKTKMIFDRRHSVIEKQKWFSSTDTLWWKNKNDFRLQTLCDEKTKMIFVRRHSVTEKQKWFPTAGIQLILKPNSGIRYISEDGLLKKGRLVFGLVAFLLPLFKGYEGGRTHDGFGWFTAILRL